MTTKIIRLPFDQPRWLVYLRRLLMIIGFDFYLKMDDRRVLETIILPYFQGQQEIKNILFIGCDWYTRGYKKFFQAKKYWTMDINPAQQKFGSNLHIIDACENVLKYFEPESLDLIVCNGIYGFGLDDLSKFNQAILGFKAALRGEGYFILGWDDNLRRTPFPLCDSIALASFDRYVFPPLGTSHYLTANEGRHTYDFFVKT